MGGPGVEVCLTQVKPLCVPHTVNPPDQKLAKNGLVYRQIYDFNQSMIHYTSEV
jgi:hypothetical protein